VEIADWIKDRGSILIPPHKHEHILRNVLLPCGAAPYGTVPEVARRIRKAIGSCVIIARPYLSLLAAYCVYTRIADVFPKAVYLLITGPWSPGKLPCWIPWGFSADDHSWWGTSPCRFASGLLTHFSKSDDRRGGARPRPHGA